MAQTPTTTIRLPAALRARVSRAAKRAAISPHSFIVDAIAEKTEQDELRHAFHRVADGRYATILSSGKTISWNEMRAYLTNRSDGKGVPKPSPRKRRR